MSVDRAGRFFGIRNGSRTCLVQTFRRAGTIPGRDGFNLNRPRDLDKSGSAARCLAVACRAGGVPIQLQLIIDSKHLVFIHSGCLAKRLQQLFDTSALGPPLQPDSLPSPNAFGFRVSGFGFQDSGFGFRVSGFGFRVSGFGLGVPGFGFQVSGLGFRVSGLGLAREAFHEIVGLMWFNLQPHNEELARQTPPSPVSTNISVSCMYLTAG